MAQYSPVFAREQVDCGHLNPVLGQILPQIAAFFATVVYASFFEHTLHKYVMHRRNPLIPYPFELHAMLHHRIFQADHTYHAQDDYMKSHVTFVPRDYLILLLVNAPLYCTIEYFTGWPITIGSTIAILGYLAMFDILHYAFHVPDRRWFESIPMFRFLKRHHLLHHKYQTRNLNVVLPIADTVLGTLVRKPNPGATLLEV